ncbi:hypothetical protein DBR32_06410 [Taibaiella sp. KBW10]|nr:hypothetical protein DBR32_06410 [Taibaiella sp. KBW10]
MPTINTQAIFMILFVSALCNENKKKVSTILLKRFPVVAHLTGEKLHQLEQNLAEIYAFRELLPI